jgi:hypothetical protein
LTKVTLAVEAFEFEKLVHSCSRAVPGKCVGQQPGGGPIPADAALHRDCVTPKTGNRAIRWEQPHGNSRGLGEAGIFAGAQTPHTLPRFRSAKSEGAHGEKSKRNTVAARKLLPSRMHAQNIFGWVPDFQA